MGFIIGIIIGFFIGMSSANWVINDEIEKYKSIRWNGVYYYPEEVINNDK